MQGIERAYGNLCIQALLEANTHLMEAAAVQAIETAAAYGKKDTLSLDAIPEIEIERAIAQFDARAILITEELGGELASRVNVNAHEPFTLFFADPTDRSKPLQEFLKKAHGDDPARRVCDIIGAPGAIAAWEAMHSTPAPITGATSAITCVREGLPIFSLILNYITQELIIVSGAGIKLLKLPHHEDGAYPQVSLDMLFDRGSDISFLPLARRRKRYDDYRTFVTFLKKDTYPENLADCRIFAGEDRKPIYDNPGGPTRMLYLSTLYDAAPVGFILANGEKIGEWIHWLTAVRFARYEGEPVFRLFEITHARPWTKEGVSMAPSPAYSIFRPASDGLLRLDIRPLCTLPRPSQFRSTFVVMPADNTWLIQVMKRCQYRELRLE